MTTIALPRAKAKARRKWRKPDPRKLFWLLCIIWDSIWAVRDILTHEPLAFALMLFYLVPTWQAYHGKLPSLRMSLAILASMSVWIVLYILGIR